jgi:cell division protease FtsH
MFGPPGTGKTLMARAVAGEAGVPFFVISGSEVTGFLIGLGVARIKKLFRQARRRGGVIFIDELDAIGGRRGRNQSHNEDDRTLNQLLVEMDGFSPREHVLVIGATNRQEDLDAALLRPGRFDRAVAVGLPTAAEREAILRLHVRQRGVPLDQTVDLGRLARLMPQTSGAELANLVNEAAIAAARERSPVVTWHHVEQARDRLLLGKERTGFRASDDEWRAVAVHEAGHALAGLLFHAEEGLHKVTIQPRGQAMGVAHFSPGEVVLHTRRFLEGQICKGLGGRAAEEIMFGPDAVTSGAKADLQYTTRVAREMVYKLGMGPGTGLVAFDDREGGGAVSGELHAAMDRDVRAIVEALYARVRESIDLHRAALEALAEALLERETLEGAEAMAILHTHGVTTDDPLRRRTADDRLRGPRRPGSVRLST